MLDLPLHIDRSRAHLIDYFGAYIRWANIHLSGFCVRQDGRLTAECRVNLFLAIYVAFYGTPIRRQSVDSLNGGLMTSLFCSVGRSGI